tara:strand:- start:3735 stop:4055 length:321 start_codon:yes stop_codon:yes gene_type:complete
MINKYKYKLVSILLCFLVLGCQGVRDSLEGKGKNNSDEFLVEKKNPLVLPPEFSSLPQPEFSKIDEGAKEGLSIKEIIGKKSIKNKKSSSTKSYSTIEKSILGKIK